MQGSIIADPHQEGPGSFGGSCVWEYPVDETRHLAHAVYVAAVSLGRTRDAEEVVRVALAETQRATGAEAASLHLLQAEQSVLLLREYAGTTPAFRHQMARLPLEDARLAETAIREERIVACPVEDHPTPVAELKTLSKPTKGKKEIAQIATISANNDKMMGDFIADASERPWQGQEDCR